MSLARIYALNATCTSAIHSLRLLSALVRTAIAFLASDLSIFTFARAHLIEQTDAIGWNVGLMLQTTQMRVHGLAVRNTPESLRLKVELITVQHHRAAKR